MNPEERITYFAVTDSRGKRTPFGIKAKDRSRHVYVIGKTGMGKSTLLENMAIQDIMNGEGLAYIDPHGGTAEKLLDYIPEHRVKDVLYFAPFDTDHPVAFNVMEDVGPARRHFVASGLMSAFKKIWVDAWSGRMEYILTNTLLALLEYPGSTLLGVNRMLSDKPFRERVVANISDPSVKSFWVNEFAKYTERFAAEATPAIQNKVGQYTSNPLIRNIIGQPKSSFDLRKMMDEKKIIIMNLSKGLVGETNTSLLGSMLTTRIYLAAMSRADVSAGQMAKLPDFYFYVDEFQSFANESFADILAEARKYKLDLTIAHQYVEQMEETVRDAVFGNVGTTIAFRVGPLDAELLEKVFAPRFTAEDVVNLGLRQIYLSLMIDSVGSPPFSAVTLPPIEQPSISYKKEILEMSRKQFSKSRVEVEREIAKWHEPVEPMRPAPPANFAPRVPRDKAPIQSNFRSENRGGNTDRPRESAPFREPPRREPAPARVEREQEIPRREITAQNTARAPQPSPQQHLAKLRDALRQVATKELEKNNKSESPPQSKQNSALRDALAKAMAERVKVAEVKTETPAPREPDPPRTEQSSQRQSGGEVSPEEIRKILSDDAR